MARRFGIGAMVPGSAAVVCGLLGCERPAPVSVAPQTEPPVRPAGGSWVEPGTGLRAAVEAARGGEVLLLRPGRHEGPLVIDVPVTIWGDRSAVVASAGNDTTIAVDGSGVRLSGFSVDGSGSRFDLLDAAVRVRADDVVVDGLEIRNALFGVLVEKAARVSVRRCEVHGTGNKAMGLRGDGIRLWETTDSEVIGNFVVDSRDCVVWYSSRNRVADNTVLRSRYGTHFMYSHDNVVVGNRYLEDVVGIFVMYSRDVAIRGNLMALASGAAGVGLGVKESGNLTVEGNDFVANTTGIYLDTSPLDLDHHNRFTNNRIRRSDTGIAFHASPKRNAFVANDLIDNVHQVRVGGEGDATDITWQGNHWDDYQGYDLDEDGDGDVPYQLRSLSSQLTSRYPDLAFFRGTPVLGLADLAGHVMPLFAPRTLVVDPVPRLRPITTSEEDSRAR